MDTHSDPIVNRDNIIPVVSITAPDYENSTSSTTDRRPGERDALKQSLSASKLKERLGNLGAQTERPESPSTISDRLFTMLLQQVLPAQDVSPVADRRSKKDVDRPNFSLPVMSNNFRRFNARIGVAFVFQNRVIRLLNWKVPTQTMSFLAVYTFLCLDPTMLAVLPVALCLFFIMVPAFLARHPPPPTNHPTDFYPLGGPPVAPPQNIKPAPELSKDFFRNMRDLQNCMEDFSRIHDSLIAFLAPPTNFSNEALSSVLFLLLTATACLLFISSHLLPWRAIFLVSGWGATCIGHPTVQELLHATQAGTIIQGQETNARSWLLRLSSSDIALSSAPEHREVEIFELQRRALHVDDAEYEPFLFSASPYSPLSPARIAGDRPRGTRFFEDVQAPKGWRWSDKKWTLDLLSREWVEERCVTGVEVEMEGERWVTDILYDEETTGQNVLTSPKKDKGKGKEKAVMKTWEEDNGLGKKGEWRRRRWVRAVERVVMAPTSGES
ncbi:Pex24p-domain-containing protein [Lepidopterella palustris CBS 459.81]|uniref:Pex24p-domain-containing protein n=1 Tax=Lepidopterella palustris CBS 459.81 TaxID=1314670 RepID=A0A8E2EEI8_9PEZI|nr:Pex24p-domain-containing protein [Lepidopterella palustris CBS 459.81]